MNHFAHSLGARTAALVDGTLDLATATVRESHLAATRFGQGYAEQHARNQRRRAEQSAARELREHPRYAVITVPAGRSAP